MEFIILKGQRMATNPDGERLEIEGIEVTLSAERGGGKRFYDRKSDFFKACCPSGVKSQGYILENGKVMLV